LNVGGPLPSNIQGETFSHVFGTNVSALEILITQNKLMGPCWLSIQKFIEKKPEPNVNFKLFLLYLK